MTGTLAVAVSGGVDSLVSAHLLRKRHADTFGIHFLTGFEGRDEAGAGIARQLGRQLDMPVAVVDLREPFRRLVVDYFSAAYQRGETPNPCLVCNPAVKFGVLLEEARRRGAKRLATGHYARVDEYGRGRYRLCRGLDATKDQSYFLARLTQDQLARACFPLGAMTKTHVKALAAEAGLRPVTRQESQDVCFIRDTSYADFLVQTTGLQPQAGDIVDSAGRKVGVHQGLHRYTVGQRRGINCPAEQAYYVLRIDARSNRLVVGFKNELYAEGCRVREINWIADPPETPLPVDTRIRYRHRAVASRLTPLGPDAAVVRFDRPQAAVTPGQGAVFYRGDEVIGGGWIEESA